MPVHTVLSPLPGTFYRRPSPDQAVFKEVGDTVAVGDTIGLIEVMKSFSPVTAEVAGKIAAFHAEDEDAVMPEQPLVDIDT
jgi:biotin carboxyl carrier protein